MRAGGVIVALWCSLASAQSEPIPLSRTTGVTLGTAQTITGAKTFSATLGVVAVSATGTFTCTIASGSNCFSMATQGSRFKYGSGSSDYFTFDGTYMEVVGNLKIDGTVTNNGSASWFLPAGVTANAGAVGAAGPNVNIGGSIYGDTTDVGNVGAGEDDLISRSAAASILRATGRRMAIFAAGTAANNANAKTLKFYVGASAIATLVLPTSTPLNWRVRATVIRTGSSTQDYEVTAQAIDSSDGSIDATTTAIGTLALTETSAITVKTTGTAVSDNDIVASFQTIDFF